MKFRAMWVLCLVLAPITFLNADTLELKNGSVIKGAYVGGSDTRIRFRVGSTVQEYAIADITSLKFEARESAAPARTPGFDDRSPDERSPDERSPDERSPENGTRQRAPESYSSSPAPQASVPNSTAASTSIPRATSQSIVVPSGTRVTIRTIDGVDSDKNHPGDKFLASLEQSLIVNDVTIAPKGASVYGKLQQVQEAGQLTGKSQLRLA